MPGNLASRAVAALVSSDSRIYLVETPSAHRLWSLNERLHERCMYFVVKGQTTCQDHNLQDSLPLYRWETNRSAYALATAAKAALQGGIVGA